MTRDNMLVPPPPGRAARFAQGFGQRALLTVDTEEEFDWNGPFRRDGWGLDHLTSLGRFQQFCEGLGVIPVYLIDWPVATSSLAREILGDAIRAGRAEVGVQLHPWVNPPFDEDVNVSNSFAGNLPASLEAEKFARLRDAIEENFGAAPLIYRAGRYGLGPATADLIKNQGLALDTSVRALFDYRAEDGPDYSGHPLVPYWIDEHRELLELPVTSVYWGMLRRQGRWLHPAVARIPKLGGLLSRLGMLEKIALTPEGVALDEALRAIDMALDDGLPVLVLSFHSPSLAPGHTPYVRSASDLDRLYDWLRGVYGYFEQRGVQPTSVSEIMQAVHR